MADEVQRDISLPQAPTRPRKILIIAGEESGDVYASRLCSHLYQLIPGVKIEGIGGSRSREAGVNTLYDVEQMSSVGVADLMGRFGFFLKVLNEIKTKLKEGEYDAVILVDYPDFNIRVAKAADQYGIPVFYYVCPQLWAWRKYRVNAVRKYVDLMIVVFPFEESFYTKRGVRAQFVGHPILDELEPIENRTELRSEFHIGKDDIAVGLVPGSRRGEVERMLPIMLEALKIMQKATPLKAMVPCADSLSTDLLNQLVKQSGAKVTIVKGRTWELFNACDYLICKSGTSTLQATLAGTPMQIVYRSDNFSYILAKALTHLKWAGLPNILAGREVAPELMQWKATPKNIASVARPYLLDSSKRDEMRTQLSVIAKTLGERGSSLRSAKLITDYMSKFSQS